MKARDIMTEDPMTALVTANVGDALEILQTLEIRHLPIIDNDGQLKGMISDRDIRNAATPYSALPGMVTNDFLARSVSEIMSGDVAAVSPEAEVDEIIDVLLEQKIGAVPVVEDSSGDLLGIVSYVDILRALRSED